MAKRNDTQNQLAELFQPKKCYTIEELSHRLNYSLISIRRFLKVIGYYRASGTANQIVLICLYSCNFFAFALKICLLPWPPNPSLFYGKQ
jgi:hypothetical protein